VREKFETNGKLINFMDGLTRQAGLKPARCKAPERYGAFYMRQFIQILFIFFSFFNIANGQVSIRGNIKNYDSMHKIAGATIYIDTLTNDQLDVFSPLIFESSHSDTIFIDSISFDSFNIHFMVMGYMGLVIKNVTYDKSYIKDTIDLGNIYLFFGTLRAKNHGAKKNKSQVNRKKCKSDYYISFLDAYPEKTYFQINYPKDSGKKTFYKVSSGCVSIEYKELIKNAP
jgi:hypothetical protein